MLAGFKVDVSHQEVERILSEVEAWYETAKEQAGVDWLPIAGIKNFLLQDLGYEDEEEFEDALHGSFEDFLAAFPHMEVKEMEGKPQLRIVARELGKAQNLRVPVLCSQQLLETTLLKDGNAELEIPDLGFAIRPSAKRQIDSLYNHIVRAVEEIEQHAMTLAEDPEQKAVLEDMLEKLRKLLDVEQPFDVLLHDPAGLSEFKPTDGVVQEKYTSVVRLRWRPPGERAFQVLVKEILNGNGRRKLLTRRMLHGETWEESALHCIEEDLAMKPNHGKYLLGQRSFDKSSYTFLQELTESDRYPGIKCCYRTHLVSYIVKEELGAIVTQRREGFPEEPTLLQGLLPETLTGTSPTSDNRDSRDGQGREKLQIPQPSYTSPRTRAESGSEMIASPTSATVTAERTTVTKQRLSLKSLPNFVWLPENMLQGVKGGDLWEQAQKHQEQHRVCSVLLGLEGTAPQMKSPFGVEHDGSGKSAPISALGNYKWSTYRSNNALQVPADHGGLRMNITKAMFEELRSARRWTCCTPPWTSPWSPRLPGAASCWSSASRSARSSSGSSPATLQMPAR
ncbi:unnamed protein product [Effrenium voratum]|nr:unnamed protein product [Effrenium voratum]